jgi:hypothetical protein
MIVKMVYKGIRWVSTFVCVCVSKGVGIFLGINGENSK